MIYTNQKNDELIISCDCGCGKGLLWQAKTFDEEDEQYFVYLTEHSWYAKQAGRIKPYFRRLWKALRGREYCLTELVMAKDEVEELSEFLYQLTKLSATNEVSMNEGESP